METILYVASGGGFFITPHHIDCSAEEYRAFPNADRILKIDIAYDEKMIDVGEGMMISGLPIAERGLRAKRRPSFASSSH